MEMELVNPRVMDAVRDVVMYANRRNIDGDIRMTVRDVINQLKGAGIELVYHGTDNDDGGDRRVSDEIRRANARAVKRLNIWREQYAELVGAIREAKAAVKKDGSRKNHQILRSLQLRATIMSDKRAWLSYDLQDTAYRYI